MATQSLLYSIDNWIFRKGIKYNLEKSQIHEFLLLRMVYINAIIMSVNKEKQERVKDC